MDAKKISAMIVLDGEKEFCSSVSSCNKSLSAMRSEMKLVEAETAGSANTLEALNKKHEVLTKTLDVHRQKEEEISKGLEHAREDYDRVGNELEEYRQKLTQAKEALQQMEKSGEASDEAMKSQRETVGSLSRTIDDGEKKYQKAENRVRDWEKQLNNAKVQTINMARALNTNSAHMKEAEDATDGCAKSIDAFGKTVDKAADETKRLTLETQKMYGRERMFEVFEVGSKAIQTLANTSYDAAKELEEGYDTIITKTGATGDALSSLTDSADNVFGDLPVEMSDVGTAIGEVNTRFGETGEALEKTSRQFLEFAEINGTDLNESIDATDRILTQFNVSSEHSGELLGILTIRGQETGKSVSELMRELDGNAATFKDLDLNLSESVNLLALLESNGVDSSTAIRGLKTAVSNYAKEGLSAREALERTIDSIKNASTETEALAIAQEVFGTKGAQVMADGIRDGRISLDDLNESMSQYGDTVGTTFQETLDPWDKAKIAVNNLKVAGSELAGGFLETTMPAIDKVTDVVKNVTQSFKNAPEPVKKTVAVLGTLIGGTGVAVPKLLKLAQSVQDMKVGFEAAKALKAMNTVQAATETVTAASTVAQTANATATAAQTVATTTQATATVAATTAQQGLNLAMLANPATLIVGGIVALTAAVAIFASGQEEAKSKTDELAKSAEAMNGKLDDAAENLTEATAGLATAMEGNLASEQTANRLADELDRLAGKTNLTTEEQSRMKTVVMELNTMFPDMGLEIDSVTGKLNMGSGEIKDYIENAVEMARIEVVQEKVKEATEKLVDAEIKLTEGQGKLKETSMAIQEIQEKRAEADQAVIDKNNELKEAQEAYSEALETGKGDLDELYQKTQEHSEAQIEYHGVLMTVSEAYERMAEDEEKLIETKEGQQAALADMYEVQNEANEQIAQATECINANTEATSANTEAAVQKQEASAASIEVLGQELEAYSQLSERQQQMAVDVTNGVLTMQENVQGALESQMNMFEEFNAGTEITKEKLLENMQSQVDGVTAWEENLTTLMEDTKTATNGAVVSIDEGLMQYLASMGPEGSTYVQEFVNMSGDELAKANELWNQSLDCKEMANIAGQDLLTSFGIAVAGGAEDMQSLLGETGANSVLGLVEGMQNAQAQAIEQGQDLGVKTVDAVNAGAGVASPSWKTRITGMYLGDGLREGLNNSQNNVQSAGVGLAGAAISGVESNATESSLYSTGYYLAVGLADGIYAGESRVIRAATDIAVSAINAANSTLEINSPSRVFRRIGSSVAEGYVKGLEDQNGIVQDAMSELLDVSDIHAELPVNEIQYAIDSGMSWNAADQPAYTVPEIAEMLQVMQKYLPYLASGSNIYLDKKKVVGEMLPEINRQLPVMAAREARR